RCCGTLRTPPRELAAPTDLGAIHAIAFHRAEPGRQGAIVRHGLALAPPRSNATSICIVFTQQTQLQHQRRYKRTIELFPTPPAQVTRQHNLAEACPDKPA